MMTISTGDLASLCRALEAQGWVVEHLDGSHRRATPPDATKPIVHMKRTNEAQAWKNLLSQLRKSGFREEEVGKKNGNGNRSAPAPLLCPACGGRTFSALTGACSVCTVASSKAPPMRSEKTLDTLFSELRDAKELHALAGEETARARGELARAQQRADECARAEAGTLAELIKAKDAFDLVFGAASATTEVRTD